MSSRGQDGGERDQDIGQASEGKAGPQSRRRMTHVLQTLPEGPAPRAPEPNQGTPLASGPPASPEWAIVDDVGFQAKLAPEPAQHTLSAP